jgi:hypothetical protein
MVARILKGGANVEAARVGIDHGGDEGHLALERLLRSAALESDGRAVAHQGELPLRHLDIRRHMARVDQVDHGRPRRHVLAERDLVPFQPASERCPDRQEVEVELLEAQIDLGLGEIGTRGAQGHLRQEALALQGPVTLELGLVLVDAPLRQGQFRLSRPVVQAEQWLACFHPGPVGLQDLGDVTAGIGRDRDAPQRGQARDEGLLVLDLGAFHGSGSDRRRQSGSGRGDGAVERVESVDGRANDRRADQDHDEPTHPRQTPRPPLRRPLDRLVGHLSLIRTSRKS